ncbi:MAG: glycosyltransferase family 4 protein [Bacteroidetes bacterium]|jgi:glycosyltransferase involved in cell wall biosynthesis|nr:glycosyltransferase family 4 protein [Bacteroidota bacterium]
MKILFLTQYYPPETGAPQNRLSDLAMRLANEGHEISILTAMPNYPHNEIYSNYRGKFFLNEVLQGIPVYRSWIFVGKSRSVISRLLNYFSFVVTSFFYGLFKIKKQDYILCESPPLFLGITGWLLSFFKGSKFIFNISDLWPESAEKLGVINNKFLLNTSEKLELFLYRRAYLITGQTQGIVSNIQLRTKNKTIHWLPNGFSEEQSYFDFPKNQLRTKWNIPSSNFILGYAGIIGYAQGLEIITEAASILRNHTQLTFVIAGDGPELEKLKNLTKQHQLKNIIFTGALSKKEALQVVSESNAAIIPLRKIDLFKGAIPSKIFENCAYGKPLLLGVDGEAKELFIDQAKAGIYFEPEDVQALAEGILKLQADSNLCEQFGENGKLYVNNFFSRRKIASDFLDVLQKMNKR